MKIERVIRTRRFMTDDTDFIYTRYPDPLATHVVIPAEAVVTRQGQALCECSHRHHHHAHSKRRCLECSCAKYLPSGAFDEVPSHIFWTDDEGEARLWGQIENEVRQMRTSRSIAYRIMAVLKGES